MRTGGEQLDGFESVFRDLEEMVSGELLLV
jgi:hypothetical protein